MATATREEPRQQQEQTPVKGVTPRDIDQAYLAERGWRNNHDGTWSDMCPPGDTEIEKRMLQHDGKTSKVIRQVVAGPAPGWPHQFAAAVQTERGRAREPVPVWRPFVSFPAAFPEKNGAERQEGWMVRDRLGEPNRGAGMVFEAREQAEAWIAKQ